MTMISHDHLGWIDMNDIYARVLNAVAMIPRMRAHDAPWKIPTARNQGKSAKTKVTMPIRREVEDQPAAQPGRHDPFVVGEQGEPVDGVGRGGERRHDAGEHHPCTRPRRRRAVVGDTESVLIGSVLIGSVLIVSVLIGSVLIGSVLVGAG